MSSMATPSHHHHRPVGSAQVHPLSCSNCRQRKIKCDRVFPCGHCKKTNLDCFFPERARHPKRKKSGLKATNGDLLARLNRMEQLIGKIQDNPAAAQAIPPPPPPPPTTQLHTSSSSSGLQEQQQQQQQQKQQARTFAHLQPQDQSGLTPPDSTNSQKTGSTTSQSRESTTSDDANMGISDRRKKASTLAEPANRFKNINFWQSLSSEVHGLRETVDGELEDEDDEQDGDDDFNDDSRSRYSVHTSALSITSRHASLSGLMLGLPGNTWQNLRTLHPTPAHMSVLCDLYLANCEPMIKIMHVPSLQRLVAESMANPHEIPSDTAAEPLLFAMYHSAVVSLTEEQCTAMFNHPREALISRYVVGVHSALSNVNFLCTANPGVLQALILFITSVRSHDRSPFAWMMTATAVRLAQGLGMHREMANTGSPPFVVEMRRRIWWALITLDTRGTEDRTSEPLLPAGTYDTHRPLHVNDTDLWPDMAEFPAERESFTDMTKVRASHIASFLRRRFVTARTITTADGKTVTSKPTFEQQLEHIAELEREMEANVLRHCDLNVPLQWTTAVIGRHIMCRVRLAVYHPLVGMGRVAERHNVSRELLLEVAVAALEYIMLIEHESFGERFRWFVGTYAQWHPAASIVVELCVQTKGPLVERAWRVIEAMTAVYADEMADVANGRQWRPIKKILAKAQAARAAAIASESAGLSSAGSVGGGGAAGPPTPGSAAGAPPGQQQQQQQGLQQQLFQQQQQKHLLAANTANPTPTQPSLAPSILSSIEHPQQPVPQFTHLNFDSSNSSNSSSSMFDKASMAAPPRPSGASPPVLKSMNPPPSPFTTMPSSSGTVGSSGPPLSITPSQLPDLLTPSLFGGAGIMTASAVTAAIDRLPLHSSLGMSASGAATNTASGGSGSVSGGANTTGSGGLTRTTSASSSSASASASAGADPRRINSLSPINTNHALGQGHGQGLSLPRPGFSARAPSGLSPSSPPKTAQQGGSPGDSSAGGAAGGGGGGGGGGAAAEENQINWAQWDEFMQDYTMGFDDANTANATGGVSGAHAQSSLSANGGVDVSVGGAAGSAGGGLGGQAGVFGKRDDAGILGSAGLVQNLGDVKMMGTWW